MAERKLTVGGTYRHFKGGMYILRGIAEHSENGKAYVIYEDAETGKLWVRPYGVFVSKVDVKKYPDAAQEYRFELIEEEKEMIELKDTIEMMTSEDYKERFRAEYYQAYIRYEKLCHMIDQYEARILPFVPKCQIDLLRMQRDSMAWYLIILRERAEIEDICLDESCPVEDIGDEVCEACAITYSRERGNANVLGETNDADK